MDEELSRIERLTATLLELGERETDNSPTFMGILRTLAYYYHSPWSVDIAGVGRILITPPTDGATDKGAAIPQGEEPDKSPGGAAHPVESTGCRNMLPQERLEIDLLRLRELLDQPYTCLCSRIVGINNPCSYGDCSTGQLVSFLCAVCVRTETQDN